MDADEFRALHDQGVLARDIAAQLGTSYAKVAAALRAQGVEPHLAKRGPKGADPELLARVRELHENGQLARDIAAELGLGYSQVAALLRADGHEPHLAKRGPRAPDLDVDEVARLHGEGLPLKDIAERVSASAYLVGRALSSRGLAPRSGRRPAMPGPRERAMAEAYRGGRTLDEIGQEHGVTRERVRQILVKQGVDRTARHVSPAARRAAQFDADRGEAVRASLEQTQSARLTAQALGLPAAEVRAFVTRHGIVLQQSLVPREHRGGRWTAEACVTALRRAWDELGRPEPLLSRAYRDWLASGGDGPSYPTLCFELGSFVDALEAAGVPAAERRVRSDRLSDEQVLDSLHRFVAAGGYDGRLTCAAYVVWAEQNGGVSLALLRRRGLKGQSWAAGLRHAGHPG